MVFRELIHRRLCDSENLTGLLSTFYDAPSIFSPSIPEHNMEGWSDKHYPLIVYNFDLQANAERNSAGTLEISYLAQNDEDTPLEQIETGIRDCMRDIVITPEDGTQYSFAWARTDGFTVEGANNDDGRKNLQLTIGSEIRFDILEYPSQITTDPDPIMAINRYLKEMYPECLILGYDRAEEIEEATGERPVIYCRLVSSTGAETPYTVAWRDCVIAVHVLCPDAEVRIKMATAIANKLSVDGEVIMFDHSPMTVRRLQANYRADYLKEGQVLVTGHYGILRYKRMDKPLNHVRYNQN